MQVNNQTEKFMREFYIISKESQFLRIFKKRYSSIYIQFTHVLTSKDINVEFSLGCVTQTRDVDCNHRILEYILYTLKYTIEIYVGFPLYF